MVGEEKEKKERGRRLRGTEWKETQIFRKRKKLYREEDATQRCKK